MPLPFTRRSLLWLAAGAVQAQAPRAAVSLVRGEDRRKNVHDALAAIDDQIRPALRRKKYVLLKPNCVSVKNQLGSTHADALRGILDYLVPRFRGPIVIAESSRDETRDAFDNFLYNRVLAEYRERKITLVDLNQEAHFRPFEIIDRDLHAIQVRLAARLFDPEAFVLGSAIPKAHDAVVATLSVKNLCLAAPLHSLPKAAERWHDKSRYHQGYRQMHFNILLTAKLMRPFWGATVIDGYEGMEGNGPLSGTPVPSRVAIASTDFVAADRVGVEVMGVNPEWVGYLNYCSRAGLGQFDLAGIELRGGVPLESVRRKYQLHRAVDKQLQWMGPL
ncbi:MAG TPA: DUF362 domain-containing protein [Bryobacteraceae bacterium]|nr:DUF362 domain-containing protein [Bryobacteraceae bacterium]